MLLAAHNKAVVLDIIEEKVAMIKAGRSPIIDAELQECLTAGGLDLTATTDPQEGFCGARLVMISTPADYDADRN